MKISANLFIITLFLFINSNITKSQILNLQFKINGLANSELIIAHHYGENNLIDDTIKIDANGQGKLVGENKLDNGLYMCIFPSHKYFEFIVDNNQTFSIETDTGKDAEAYLRKMKISNSKINSLFRNYQLFMIDKTNKSQKLRQEYHKTKSKQIKDELTNINNEVMTYWDSIHTNYKGTFLDIMLKALKDVKVPEPPKDKNGNILDSMFQYNYYKDHYFDNVTFTDTRLLYSPIFYKKLDFFYKNIVIRRPDSAISASDMLLNKLNKYPEYYKYALSYIFNRYIQSKYMGFDQVTVHLAEKYYLSGKAPWATAEFLGKLRNRINKMKPNMIGSIAPKMDKAQTLEGYFYPLHDVDAKFTIVVFWEPSCGHCKHEIPLLHEMYQEYKNKDVAVYAVYTQADTAEWTKFISEHNLNDFINVYDPNNFTNFRNTYDVYSTPTLYLLDKNKKIIGKRIDNKTAFKIIDEHLKK